jgi:hypothetical protein
VAVELGRDARIGVAHDPLHGRQVSAGHHEQRGRRVADVMEPDRPHLPDWPQLHPARRAPADLVVRRLLDVAATLAAASKSPARQDVRSPKRAPQNLFELDSARQQAPIAAGEDEVVLRLGHRDFEIGRQLGRDRHGVSMTALRGVAIVRTSDRDEARVEVDVLLAEPEQLALAHARVQRRREQTAPPIGHVREHRHDLLRAQVVG